MKKIFLILMFSWSLNVFSQNKIKYISHYYLKTVDSTEINYFKIRNETFSFERGEGFYKNDSLVLKCPEDSFVTYEVYDDKFLIASYYPLSESKLAFGPSFRAKGRFIIMSLKDPAKKWEFDFKYRHNSESIDKFNPKTRELFVKEKLIGKPR